MCENKKFSAKMEHSLMKLIVCKFSNQKRPEFLIFADYNNN
jgi:hypothetical protein